MKIIPHSFKVGIEGETVQVKEASTKGTMPGLIVPNVMLTGLKPKTFSVEGSDDTSIVRSYVKLPPDGTIPEGAALITTGIESMMPGLLQISNVSESRELNSISPPELFDSVAIK